MSKEAVIMVVFVCQSVCLVRLSACLPVGLSSSVCACVDGACGREGGGESLTGWMDRTHSGCDPTTINGCW